MARSSGIDLNRHTFEDFDSNVAPKLSKRSYGGSVTLNRDVTDTIGLVAIGEYEEARQSYSTNGDFLPVRRGDTYFNDRLHQFTGEVCLQNKAPAPVEWVVGANVFVNRVGIASTLDLSDVLLSKLGTDYAQKNRSVGVFADGTVHLASRLKLGA